MIMIRLIRMIKEVIKYGTVRAFTLLKPSLSKTSICSGMLRNTKTPIINVAIDEMFRFNTLATPDICVSVVIGFMNGRGGGKLYVQ